MLIDSAKCISCIALQAPAEQSLGEGTVFDITVHHLIA